MKTITAYTGEWHNLFSSAFKELLFEPLREKITIQTKVMKLNASITVNSAEPIVFCQVPPPAEMMKHEDLKLVWIPMWDDARHFAPAMWANIPKNVRIVAFSDHLANRARQAGLAVLQLKYFKDPSQFPAVAWNKGNSLFYWNRAGMVGPDFLEKMCAALKVDRLIFRGDIDPIFGENIRYQMPSRLGNTIVENLPFLSSKEAYYRALDQANIVIAPRLSEGVGMVFLEAMARGCAVFAYDGPTMSEYITHGQDGYLFPTVYATDADRNSPDFSKKVLSKYPISDFQNWDEISRIDLKALGSHAREKQQEGFIQWKQSLDEFANFLADW